MRSRTRKNWTVVAVTLAGALLAGCSGGEYVNFGDANERGGVCTPAKVSVPDYFSVWSIRPTSAVVIEQASLVPGSGTSEAKVLRLVAETRPWAAVTSFWVHGKPEQFHSRGGRTFAQVAGVKPVKKLRVAAGQKVWFAALVRFNSTKRVHWRGLRIDYGRTTHVIPFWLTVHPTRGPINQDTGCNGDK